MSVKKKTIGMRNIKTALAVILCIILTRAFALLGQHFNFGYFDTAFDFLFVRTTPLYSSIAAVVAVGSTMHETIEAGVARILGTFIGGAFAVLHLWLTEVFRDELFYYLTVFAFVVGIIYICNLSGHSDVSSIGGMIFLIAIFSVKDEPPFVYAIHRLIDTAGGVLIAFLVNRFVGKIRA